MAGLPRRRGSLRRIVKRKLLLVGVLAALSAGAALSGGRKVTPPLRVLIVYGSEKKAWLDEQMAAFNARGPRLASGAPYMVEGKAMGSGEAMQDILEGRLQPAVFSPASAAYLTLLNHAWL